MSYRPHLPHSLSQHNYPRPYPTSAHTNTHSVPYYTLISKQPPAPMPHPYAANSQSRGRSVLTHKSIPQNHNSKYYSQSASLSSPYSKSNANRPQFSYRNYNAIIGPTPTSLLPIALHPSLSPLSPYPSPLPPYPSRSTTIPYLSPSLTPEQLNQRNLHLYLQQTNKQTYDIYNSIPSPHMNAAPHHSKPQFRRPQFSKPQFRRHSSDSFKSIAHNSPLHQSNHHPVLHPNPHSNPHSYPRPNPHSYPQPIPHPNPHPIPPPIIPSDIYNIPPHFSSHLTPEQMNRRNKLLYLQLSHNKSKESLQNYITTDAMTSHITHLINELRGANHHRVQDKVSRLMELGCSYKLSLEREFYGT